MSSILQIGNRIVGPGHPCMVIAEVAMLHDGSLGLAHAFIDAAAAAGADAVKFQTHIASAESTPAEPFRVAFSRQDATRYEYWQRTAFNAEQWSGLAQHARERGLLFLSSPFSPDAVTLLERLDMPAWKVASGETSNTPLLRLLARAGRPVMLSSGMSSMAELDRAVAAVRSEGATVAVFQCTSEYPCPPEHVGLEQVEVLAQRFQCPVGLSDHSGTIYAGLGAVALGANLLEVHITLSREMFGPDVIVSLTPAELQLLVTGVRFLDRALTSPVDKDAVAQRLSPVRKLFNKSVVAARDLAAGSVLAASDLALRKPGTGLPPDALEALLGRKLTRNLTANELVGAADVSPALRLEPGT